jgi:hypothetical protein
MFARINKIYHEFPRLFWIVVLVRFIDGIGGTLLFPFFALYITQKFGVGMTEAGILLGMSSLSWHSAWDVFAVRLGGRHAWRCADRQIRSQAVDRIRSCL